MFCVPPRGGATCTLPRCPSIVTEVLAGDLERICAIIDWRHFRDGRDNRIRSKIRCSGDTLDELLGIERPAGGNPFVDRCTRTLKYAQLMGSEERGKCTAGVRHA